MTQICHTKLKWDIISKLIKGIWKIPQKLLKYFNGTITSTSFAPPSAVLPVIFCLNLPLQGLGFFLATYGWGGGRSIRSPLLKSLIMMLFTWNLVHLFFYIKGTKWYKKIFQNGYHFLMTASKIWQTVIFYDKYDQFSN